jgi:hypothetical protein
MNAQRDDPIPTANGEALAWAAKSACRLRTIQASFSDDAPENRRSVLVEEIQSQLRQVPESSRRDFLDALSSYFPVLSGQTETPVTPAPAEPSTLELSERLMAGFAQAAPEERAAISERLRAAGLLVVISERPDLPMELRGKLGLTPEQPIDPERFANLFVILADIVLALDSVIWGIWRNLAPRSSLKREPAEVVRGLLGRYLQGDREVAAYQIGLLLNRTRQVTVALLSAFGSAGTKFAVWYLNSFAPERIRRSVEAGGPGFLKNIDQRCWHRYSELAGQLNGPLIEEHLVTGIVSYVEEVTARPDAPKP